ncbi:MAG TPA: WcaF family extracellular polysaccharide biosynthesis acetyltransferase [Hyphomicrobium sp.]|jgi:putative colanic acid biosynthesis acetyltransferase WcaF|nr:WcaF family extracellular polysaccharide biosynthesis acetyltransferase [Rhizomicrobium sp.]HVX35786.1 WcaF family extracellular polysaccharide biosynthesis acetyltransferase [Hyphomicrobium sp.]
MRLDTYDCGTYVRGRSKFVEAIWLVVQALLVSSRIPGSAHRRCILRLFGSDIGKGVKIKPGVRIKFPWRLTVGDHSWLGEDVWIDNLAAVSIGAHCCISQGAYLCTGSHDWTKPDFDLITRPIHVADRSWIAARSVVGPGVIVGEGSVLSLGGVATKDLAPWMIYAGTPSTMVKTRSVPAQRGS